jgi:hypothetical protein
MMSDQTLLRVRDEILRNPPDEDPFPSTGAADHWLFNPANRFTLLDVPNRHVSYDKIDDQEPGDSLDSAVCAHPNAAVRPGSVFSARVLWDEPGYYTVPNSEFLLYFLDPRTMERVFWIRSCAEGDDRVTYISYYDSEVQINDPDIAAVGFRQVQRITFVWNATTVDVSIRNSDDLEIYSGGYNLVHPWTELIPEFLFLSRYAQGHTHSGVISEVSIAHTKTQSMVMWEDFKEAADGLTPSPTPYLNEREVLRRVMALSFAYRMGQLLNLPVNDYKAALWNELNSAAAFQDWSNPANGLKLAEMTTAFAIGYDWLFEQWTPSERQILRTAILQKGLTPALEYMYERTKGNTSNWNGWLELPSNWTCVCNAGFALGALAIMDSDLSQNDQTIARKILAYAMRSLPYGAAAFSPDGGHDEGPTYLEYAARYLVKFLAGAETALGSALGFSYVPGVGDIGMFAMHITEPEDRKNRFQTFMFSDCGATADGPQLQWLAGRYGQPEYARYRLLQLNAREIPDPNNNAPTATDIIWRYSGGESADTIEDLARGRVTHSCEVATLREGWGKQSMFVALKAGQNDGRLHEQMDIGTFCLAALGYEWAVDLGSEPLSNHGDYTHALPGQPRFHHYRARAEGHNTLVMNPGNGEDQRRTMLAPITGFNSAGDHPFAIADLTTAYSTYTLSTKRGIRIIKSEGSPTYALLQDEVQAITPVANLYWFMHYHRDSYNPPQVVINSNTAILRPWMANPYDADNRRLFIKIVEPVAATFEIKEAQLMNDYWDTSEPNPDFRKLSIRLQNVTTTRIVVIFVPYYAPSDPPVPDLDEPLPSLDSWQ